MSDTLTSWNNRPQTDVSVSHLKINKQENGTNKTPKKVQRAKTTKYYIKYPGSKKKKKSSWT